MDLSELGKLPIPGDNPAGIDAKYDPNYDALQKEIDKMSSATSGGGIDWKRVVTLASDILAGKSKDLQAATYLAAGLIQTQSLDGLGLGTLILKDLIENFWDNLYPPKKRMRGRINALSWWLDRAQAFLQEYDPGPLPAEKIQTLREAIQGLDRAVSERADEAPLISRLVDGVNRLPVQVEVAPAPAPGPEPATTAPTTVAAPLKPTPAAAVLTVPSAPPVAAPKSAADADQVIQAGLDLLVKAADFLRSQDPGTPMAYKLTRLAAWLTVDRLPVADSNKTLIPPPDSMIRTALDNLLSGRQYQDLVQAAESRVTEFLFWLDLSRLTAEALEQLGGQYRSAAEMVTLETVLYVRRLPGLENLTYADGTPFADRETRAWLKANTLGAEHGGLSVGDSGIEAEVAEASAQVQTLVKDKKVGEALSMLHSRLKRSSSGRGRLLWTMAVAQLLADTGQSVLARPYFEELLAVVADFKLENWEPDLAFNALRVAYQGLAQGDDQNDVEQARVVLGRLARINPAEALKMAPGR